MTGHAPASHDVLEWTSKEVVGHIRRGWITAEQYATRVLARLKECEVLKAITWMDENRVLESARTVDSDRAAGKALGALAGLPFVAKDNIHTVGFPTTGGTSTLKSNFPKDNAPVVQSLLDGGAILLAKTNMDELGREFTTANLTYGLARNPYDLNRVPGGGAGGTAAAIAARISPTGLGSDTAGSARIPASYCGIAGFRPTMAGRMKSWTLGSWAATRSEDGFFPIVYGVSTPAPMGRTVSDIVLMNSIVTGVPETFAPSLRGVRIGVPKAFYWDDLDAEVAQTANWGLEILRDRGVILVDIDLGDWAKAADETFFTVATARALANLADYLAVYAPNITVDQVVAGLEDKAVSARVQNSIKNPYTPQQATQGELDRRRLALQYEDLFREKGIAAMVYPTVPILAPLFRSAGNAVTDTVRLNGKDEGQFLTAMRNTHLASTVGMPSVEIPVALSQSGLPVGLSFDSVSGDDSRLLHLGLAIESAFGRLPAPRLPATSSADTPPAPLTVSTPASARPSPTQASPAQSAAPQAPKSTDSLDLVLTLLKRSAYLSMHAATAAPGAANTFAAKSPLRRYDVDFALNGCGQGFRAFNRIGDVAGAAQLNWTFQPGPDNTRAFTMQDAVRTGDSGQNTLRLAGVGRITPLPTGNGQSGIDAYGDIVGGGGIFAGCVGSYVVTGSCDAISMSLHFTLRVLDPTGRFQADEDPEPLSVAESPDRGITCIALLGEPDPDHPIQIGSAVSTTHALLRSVHTEFDSDCSGGSLRSSITLGPIVARYSAEVSFNPAELAGPAHATPATLRNVNIEFTDGVTGSFQAAINDGRAYAMQLAGLSGPLFRLAGFGPVVSGTGRFANTKGMLSLIAASDLVPAAFSNLYLLHLIDPERNFRC